MKSRQGKMIWLMVLFISLIGSEASADWETGIKSGFDSNVNRSVSEARSDAYLKGYALYTRAPEEKDSLNWTLALLLEGVGYVRTSDLNYGSLTLEPGIDLYRGPLWTISVSPLLQLKGMSDSDQAAVAFGGKVGLRQQWQSDLYTGQYYIYRDSRAREDVYSFKEQALGVYGGVAWAKSLLLELVYELSAGDSFTSVGSMTTIPAGRGRRYSTTFRSDVVSETVSGHTFGVNLSVGLTSSLSLLLEYYLKYQQADSGSYSAHEGALGLGYRF
ncbi:MAG: hypothetical protein U1C55_07820 [Smithellaceae bacterium]|nr:hypothetical protein [Smithellaceae bacterium]